jgi:hypothetical protein
MSWNFLGAEKTDANQKHGAPGRPTFELLLIAAQAHAAHAIKLEVRRTNRRYKISDVLGLGTPAGKATRVKRGGEWF